jgi:hypothetical protein
MKKMRERSPRIDVAEIMPPGQPMVRASTTLQLTQIDPRIST